MLCLEERTYAATLGHPRVFYCVATFNIDRFRFSVKLFKENLFVLLLKHEQQNQKIR
jgi:hypothetical protein